MNTKERVRIIVGFGDIRGFSAFYRMVEEFETEYHPFMDEFDDTVKKYAGKDLFKEVGDGIMCIKEIDESISPSPVTDFIISRYRFVEKVQHLIKTKLHPRPDGFRMRVACGHVWKKQNAKGEFDYRGERINLAFKLLQIYKDNPFICHESVKQMTSLSRMKRANLRFKKLDRPKFFAEDIEMKDLDALWAVERTSRA